MDYKKNKIKPLELSTKLETKFTLQKKKDIFDIRPRLYYNPPYDSSWFETENKVSLNKYIKKLFSISKKYFKSNTNPDTIKGILVPHAGIRYSGLCSAAAYSQIIGRTQPIKRIILLCTNHESSDNFISTSYTDITSYNKLSTSTSTSTLTSLKIDTKTIDNLKPYLKINDNRFNEEHSFFNQLPFIESILEQQSSQQTHTQTLLLPFLISNSTNLMDIQIRENIKKIIILLLELLKYPDTILICTSDLSHINGHFETKVKTHIHQNIRKHDNEILQFIYDGINGIKNRNQKIDDILFIQNAPSYGTMAMYFFAKLLNMYSGGLDYSSSSSSSSSSSGSKSPDIKTPDSKSSDNKSSSIYKIMQIKEQITNIKLNQMNDLSIQKIFTRVCCYYTSLMRDNINIYNTTKDDTTNFNFNPLELIADLNITDIKKSSVSYAGLIFTTQPYIEIKENRKIENIFSQYEKLALIGFIREQLYKQLDITTKPKLPHHLILPINCQSFSSRLGVYISIYKDSALRSCNGTTETSNYDFTILNNIKKITNELALNKSRYKDLQFLPIEFSEINNLDINLTFLRLDCPYHLFVISEVLSILFLFKILILL
jgi:AmmeMemoRadiSam system protein B